MKQVSEFLEACDFNHRQDSRAGCELRDRCGLFPGRRHSVGWITTFAHLLLNLILLISSWKEPSRSKEQAKSKEQNVPLDQAS